MTGAAHPRWRGGSVIHADGYRMVVAKAHPRAGKSGYVFEHILIAERALGHYLPKGAEIHHVDENPANNERDNLVICQSVGYHKLLHQRLRALLACGNPDARKCTICKRYDRQHDIRAGRRGQAAYHNTCKVDENRRRRNLYPNPKRGAA
jgi:hypothetical protein